MQENSAFFIVKKNDMFDHTNEKLLGLVIYFILDKIGAFSDSLSLMGPQLSRKSLYRVD